jgi:hypothetical protein
METKFATKSSTVNANSKSMGRLREVQCEQLNERFTCSIAE